MSKQGRLVAAGLALGALAFVATRIAIDRDAPLGPSEALDASSLEPRELDAVRSDERDAAPSARGEARSTITRDSSGALDDARSPELTGTILLRLVRGDDEAPVPDALVRVSPWSASDSAFRAFDVRTGADGSVRIERVPAGRVGLAPLAGGRCVVALAPGEILEHSIHLPRGYALLGQVVDRTGAAVDGARVWVSQEGNGIDHGNVVARSDARGGFRIEQVGGARLVAARSASFAPSPVAWVSGPEGGEARVRLVLGARCGRVEGRVVDPSGAPVTGALVRIGSTDEMTLGEHAQRYPPFDLETDADGRFEADCVWPGRIPFRVRAEHFAQQASEVEVFEGATANLFVELGPPVSLAGVVKDERGEPQSGVHVQVRPYGKFEHVARSAGDGSYRIEGLAVGELRVRAEADERGRDEIVLHALAGQALEWNPVLSRGLSLHGRVLAEDGSPLAGWEVEIDTLRWTVLAAEERHRDSVSTDEQGGFAFADLREVDYELEVETPVGYQRALLLRPVRPQRAELVLRIPDARVPSVVVAGRLVDRAGRPCKDAQVWVETAHAGATIEHADPDTGAFELGPYPPGRLSFVTRTGEARIQRFGPRDCAAGERWELGTLEIGGTGSLLVRFHRARGAPSATPDARLVYAGRWMNAPLALDGDSARAEGLGPGRYELCVAGGGFACASTPFEIRADEETAIEVELQCGVQRRVRVHLATAEPLPIATLAIDRASGEPVLRYLVGGGPEVSWESTLSFAPGSYRAEARLEDGRGASTAFTVDASALDPSPVELRIE